MSDDSVNHPKHYNDHPSGVECITITRHMNFNLGNAMKYLWRAGIKSPDPVQDLKKAAWYIQDEIARLENAGAAKIVEVVKQVGAPANIALPPNYSNGERKVPLYTGDNGGDR